ncbi:MAG: phosphoglycerate mutase (2,3-diphosphoglycerate-independent) [Lachnospiraceae bacterium]|jgi:2,3-bisphosphoglycerate-independent phosphoglycerate mutase|nr:phosphoglycerate mutase (2,3-diphosphoglycerate-independent) [Lachnospiraceae bacterium]
MSKTDSIGGQALARAVEAAYGRGQTDYSMEPLAFWRDGEPVGTVKPGDAVVFCCRRGEREVELTEAFTQEDFPHFDREALPGLEFIILTMYHEKFAGMPIAFAPQKTKGTLAEAISAAGMRQFHIAESEKYAHVTYFLNGGNNAPFPGETDVKIPSPKGVPFDQVPQMEIEKVTSGAVGALEEGYEFVVVNYANGDVIGHTSNSDAKYRCAAAVDQNLGVLLDAAKREGYVAVVTADHGNLETLTTAEGKPHVAHTTVPVACFVIDGAAQAQPVPQDGILGDVAPTVLSAMGIPAPSEMTGENLVPAHDFGGRRKVLLVILDGWGVGEQDETNPIYAKARPVWSGLWENQPHSLLQASGESVGLQAGKTGNSEAGHGNIGAGRVVMQDDIRLDMAMKDGSFAQNEVFLSAMERVKEKGAALHLLALLTKKSSHGSVDYPLALMKMAKSYGLEKVYVHVIFDGRSTEPGSAPALLEEFEQQIKDIGVGVISGGIGRGIALDRDGNYGRIQKAYELLVHGAGEKYA